MDALTIAFPFYNNATALAWRCGRWASWPREIRDALRIVVIDDFSPEPAYPILRKMRTWLDISLYRITEDKGWNCIGAKNLAMKKTKTEWNFLADADIALLPESVQGLLADEHLDSGRVYNFQRVNYRGEPIRMHADTLLITRDHYWDVGGYDEDFSFKMGGCCLINELRRRHGDLPVLPYRVMYMGGLFSDATSLATDEQVAAGRERRREVRQQKADGLLPATPTNPCRFSWEKLL